MKSRHTFLLAILMVLMVSIPFWVHAQVILPPNNPPAGTVTGIENPLKCKDCGDLSGLIIAVTKEVAKIGFYVVVIFIIYSGFLFVKAAGNETKLKEARQAFLYTIIGAAILLGATLLANVIDGTIKQLNASGTNKTSQTTTL